MLRKARGAYFTPPAIADYVVRWGVRSAEDRVLEPSCGEAAFLTSAVTRLRTLANHDRQPVVYGAEIHENSAGTARVLVEAAGGQADIRVGDFFHETPEPIYDAVLGNPPYVRYQSFTGDSRARSREAALRGGVTLTGLASSWAAFTVHSALFLRRGGRLGLVVPAELLSVNYASDVRRFLMRSFKQVDLILFTERVFPEVQEEVVLLLADGYQEGHTDHANVYQAHNAADLDQLLAASTFRPADPADKWTPLLMDGRALEIYTSLITSGAYVPLQTWGETTLGMVTGNNKYFALSPERAATLGVPRRDLLRLSPPGSRHLRGLVFSEHAYRELGERGASTLLFRPRGEPSPQSWDYIRAGETAGVDRAYKCRVRRDWWRVPLVKPADLLLTYMNADTPRLTTNSARAHHLNSVHGVYLHGEHADLARQHLPTASLTSLTLVGAETVGRAYGGGMLKLEPREADRLPVPSPELVSAASAGLTAVAPQMATLLRNGRLIEAAKLVDEVILVKELGMCRSDASTLRDEFTRLSQRRSARAR
ncbi:class I SAM-dependent DNA methyltransferase [uncultured Aeromicrobium sp.]|uniref:HsdM family class I SAM-dependent methyltransferase n=1 Tax=uncultured Aeromicrobium sp. TaxID=337820 RepID=UPI0025F595B4|nr:N-6 DNA methylase [uncultured Aeromicrobium sp.]